MRLFLVDASAGSENCLILNARAPDDIQHRLEIVGAYRFVYVVLSQKHENDKDVEMFVQTRVQQSGFFLKKSNMEDSRMSFIHPTTHTFVISRRVFKLAVPISDYRHLFRELQTLASTSKYVDCVLGKDGTPIEDLIVSKGLKGWFEFDNNHPTVTRLPTQGSSQMIPRYRYTLSGTPSLRSILATSSLDTKGLTTPNLSVLVVHQYSKDPSLFAIQDSSSPDNDAVGCTIEHVNAYIANYNPTFVALHDLNNMDNRLSVKARLNHKPYPESCDQVLIDTYLWCKDLVPMKKDYSLFGLADHFEWPTDTPMATCSVISNLLAKLGIVELILQISMRTGQPCSKTRSKLGRVEWMMVHRFRAVNCIPPDRNITGGEDYEAGMVLDPYTGIYSDEWTMLLDFRSLYPSICIEYNLCFSHDGRILCHVLRDLIETRKALAIKEKTCFKTFVYRICLKLLANATYGALACPQSRLYSLNIAKIITLRGREQLQLLRSFVDDTYAQCRVIYGDTDSVMVTLPKKNNTIEAVRALAAEIVKRTNSRYTYLELEHEEVFSVFILFGKKRYAAVPWTATSNGQVIFKGLDLVKRGFAPAGSRLCEAAVMAMISGLKTGTEIIADTYKSLKELLLLLDINELELSDLVITKELSKQPSQYNDVTNQHHVQAALSSGMSFFKGDFITYVMTASPDPTVTVPVPRFYYKYLRHAQMSLAKEWYQAHIVGMVDRVLSIYPAHTMVRLQSFIHESAVQGIVSILGIVASTMASLKPVVPLPAHARIVCKYCRHVTMFYGYGRLVFDAESRNLHTGSMHSHVSIMDVTRLILPDLFICRSCKQTLTFETVPKEQLHVLANVGYAVAQYNCEFCQSVVIRSLSELAAKKNTQPAIFAKNQKKD
jgi:hypothetical protein